MQMTNAELDELKQRCYKAMLQRFTLGRSDQYVAVLVAELGTDVLPVGATPMGPEHVLALVDRVIEQRASGHKPPTPKPAEVKPKPRMIEFEAVLKRVEPPQPVVPTAPELSVEPPVPEPVVEPVQVETPAPEPVTESVEVSSSVELSVDGGHVEETRKSRSGKKGGSKS